jgi:uncharacterized protein (TIGR03083 family)
MLEREWLLGVARAERDQLGRTIQYVPPERWEAPSPIEEWRVQDVVAHLAGMEVAAAQAVAGERPTEFDEYAKTTDTGIFDLDGYNAWSVSRRRDEAPVRLALEWGRAADLLLGRVSKTAPEEWTERKVPWVVGDLRLGYHVQARVAEWWSHGEDVREGAGLPPRWEHPPMYCVNDLAVRMLPYALSVEGHSFPGRSLQVQLEGPGEGVWHQGLEARQPPGEGKRPDAYIAGRSHAFAAVANKRVDPDVCLYEGLLGIGGDAEIARACLRSLRRFA